MDFNISYLLINYTSQLTLNLNDMINKAINVFNLKITPNNNHKLMFDTL